MASCDYLWLELVWRCFTNPQRIAVTDITFVRILISAGKYARKCGLRSGTIVSLYLWIFC